jgi:nucleotide-binding universal stress UspA family protein
VEFGEPYKNIVEEAEKEGVDWIVISTHGRTGLSHLVMGSVTEKVVRYAPCPVLSVHPSQAGKTQPRVAAAG